MSKKTHIEVEVGQVWADCDWRNEGRTVEVLALVANRGDGGFHTLREPARYARCKVVTDRVPRLRGAGFKSSVGLITWVRMDRMRPTSTGFRLVPASPSPDQENAG